jgi:hypothetical protein
MIAALVPKTATAGLRPRTTAAERKGEDNMSNAVLTAIVVPIVVAVALAAWIVAVYRADKNPFFSRTPRGSKPRREVIGGSFRGTGGRQLMPLPGEEPAGREDRQVPGDADYQHHGGS